MLRWQKKTQHVDFFLYLWFKLSCCYMLWCFFASKLCLTIQMNSVLIFACRLWNLDHILVWNFWPHTDKCWFYADVKPALVFFFLPAAEFLILPTAVTDIVWKVFLSLSSKWDLSVSTWFLCSNFWQLTSHSFIL